MFIQRIPRSKHVLLKGVTVRLLVGLMVFYLFASLITSPVLASGPDVPEVPDGSWTECATEGANCSFSGMKEVRLWGTGDPEPNYGFVSKTFTDGTACTVAAFGYIDPAKGAYKKCYYRDVQLDSAVTAVATELDKKVTITFNVYAVQAGTLDQLKKSITVKKTGDSDYTALDPEDTVANPTSTDTSSTLVINFKDKLVGSENYLHIDYLAFRDNNGWRIDRVVTSLIVGDTPDGSLGWTDCAAENEYCSFAGTKDVRFWASGQPDKFKSIVSTNGTGCKMAAFGNDPAVGTAKRCYYRDVQFDSGVTAVVSGLNKKVMITFPTYAIQAGTLDELKSKITIKKTGADAYTALGAEDSVANPTSTAAASTLEVNFKDPLVGAENAIQIAPGAFKDSNDRLVAIPVKTLLVVGNTPAASYGWANCAADGEVCGFYGRKEVRYWGIGTPVANYGYLSKIITSNGGNVCTLFAFGTADPAPGSTKRCYYRDVQLDTEMTTAVSGLNKKVTFTFQTYAMQAGTLEELKSKITVKKAGASAYTALGAEDIVTNPTSTAASSTLVISFKEPLVGLGNAIQIAPGAFKDSNGQTIYIAVSSSLTLLGLGPDGSIGWTDCAAEGGKCNFSGRKEVRYWGTGTPAVPANYGFVSKIITDGTNCPFNSLDPAYGTYKRCYYRDVQLDSGMTTVVGGTNNRVAITFNTYAMQAGTLEELKSKITVKKTGASAYTALGDEDFVANPKSAAESSTLEINFKYPLVGSENAIQIAPGAFKDSNGELIDTSIMSSLTLLGYGPDGSIGWTDCATFGAICDFVGAKEVRLWGIGIGTPVPNYGFISKTSISGRMACTLATFGYVDPAPNTYKKCFYRDVQPYSLTNSVVSGLNKKVTFTFNTYAIQAGTLAELKSKIEVKKTGASAYTTLGPEDAVENPTPSTLVINFKDALVGSENSVVIAPGAFKDGDGQLINLSIASPLTLVPTAPDGSFGWTECASDGGKCNFSGTKEVRYWGIGTSAVPGFISKVLTGGAACNGTFFGNSDPAPGNAKKCYYRDVQLDSAMTAVVSGPNNKVTFTFTTYAKQAGTLAELKSKITVKKSGASAYTALGPEDTVAATGTSTSRSSTFEINFKDPLVGSGNSIQIDSGAFKDWYGQPINTPVSFSLQLWPTAPDGSSGWTYCSEENQNCLFSGQKEVRFWGTGTPAVPANYGYVSKISYTYIGCIASSFGNIDPAPGTIKRCFYRDAQPDSMLSNLSVDQGTLAFSPTRLNYMVEVPNTATRLNFNVTKAVPSQTLTVTGSVYTSVTGDVYSTVTGNVYAYTTSKLNAGFNPIEIKVTGQDGTSFTYNLTVYRASLIATATPIPVTTEPVSIIIPYGVNASVQAPVPTPVPDIPTTVQTTLPQVEATASTVFGNVRVTIPSGTTVTAPAGWNGAISLPHQGNYSVATNGTIQAAIEVGSTTQSLTFDKAVRIVIPYLAGTNVGFVRSGETVVIPITTVLTVDSQAAGDALPAGGEGKINVGSDLVIWTKHFTQFVAYTTETSSGGGGGGGASLTNSDYIYVSTGGTLTLNGAKITVPAEVVAGNVSNFKVTVDKVTDTSSLPMDASSKRISDVFEIKKDIDSKFTKAVSITLPFDVKHVDLNQSVIGIYWLNEETQTWILLDNIQVDTANGSVTGSVDHFTKFAVLATAKPMIPTISVVFSDISGHWSEANIKQAVRGGIVTGYPDGTFKPNAAVTRAEFAVMLLNAIKTQGAGAELEFTDKVMIGAWAQKAVAQAVQAGVITGYEDGTFRPDAIITRAEMAAMIAGVSGPSIEASTATGFADDKAIPGWAKSAVALMKKLGYLEGKGNNIFDPNAGTTRGEAVTALLKIMALKNK